MRRRRLPDQSYSAYQSLPASRVRLSAAQWLAVHQSGDWRPDLTPVVCLPGYIRNMSDFADFIPLLRSLTGENWPVAALDLRGRGRSSDRSAAAAYSTLADAKDVGAVLAALGVEKCLVLGQDHGGHVAMALAAQHPALLAGAILIDSGPVLDSRGLVRMRSNLAHVEASRSWEQAQDALEHILSADYPGQDAAIIDRLSARLYFSAKGGRAMPLFDPALLARLQDVESDDVFEPQWLLFNAMAHMPVLLARSQLTDQLRRETFEEMAQRRHDAVSITIAGQGSPALLNGIDEVGALADFVKFASANTRRDRS